MKIVTSAFLGVLLIVLSGCGTQKVLNVQNQTVMSQNELSLEDLGSKIIVAGRSLGWNMTKISDGEIIGDINVRNKHEAEIRITYNSKVYNVEYVNSKNLNYNQSNNTIHNGYNRWIKSLNSAIDSACQMQSFAETPVGLVKTRSDKVRVSQDTNPTQEQRMHWTE